MQEVENFWGAERWPQKNQGVLSTNGAQSVNCSVLVPIIPHRVECCTRKQRSSSSSSSPTSSSSSSSSCTILQVYAHYINVPFKRLALSDILFRHLMRYLLSERRWSRIGWRRVHPSASPSWHHSKTGCHCGPFRWLWSPQTAFLWRTILI